VPEPLVVKDADDDHSMPFSGLMPTGWSEDIHAAGLSETSTDEGTKDHRMIGPDGKLDLLESP